MQKKLLHTPEGVRDIYNGECENKLYIQKQVHNIVKLYGYRDIETPSFEFFDIFNKERGSVQSKNMFKFFDREGNTMVLRPDFTPAIARCAAKYFEDESVPIKLCYSGNTFINNSSYQGRLKECTQTGCELIGDASVQADAEIIALVIESLLASGLTEFQVEVGQVEFFKGLVEEAGLNDDTENELKEIIKNKNFFKVEDLLADEKISDKMIESFYMLPQMFGSIEKLEEAKNLTSNERSLNAISHLEKVFELLKVYGYDKYVSFDLGMLSTLDYYTGIIFKAYTYGVGEPIANGGRYDLLISQFGKPSASIGFVILIDTLLQALRRQNISIPNDSNGKMILYSEEFEVQAIKLASYFRHSGVMVNLMKKSDDLSFEEYNEFCKKNYISETITVDEALLERYGIK